MPWRVEQVIIGTSNPMADFVATLSPDDRVKLAALLTMLQEQGNTMKMPHSKTARTGVV